MARDSRVSPFSMINSRAAIPSRNKGIDDEDTARERLVNARCYSQEHRP